MMKHIHTIKKSQCNLGFTLVETLVAIGVLMISIAGPLVVASKGLNAALFARDQLMASYLAQETLELVKNIRDNNLSISPTPKEWDDGFALCTSASSACDISAVDFITSTCNGTSGGCALHYDTAKGYNSRNIGTETIFKRYFYMEDVTSTPNTGEKRVKIVVNWRHGTIYNEFVLLSTLVDDKR
jgi:type II secretory pathway pseudopilin PulG